MLDTLNINYNHNRYDHLLNILLPILVTVAGMTIDVIGQPQYLLIPIVVVPSAIVTDVSVCTV